MRDPGARKVEDQARWRSCTQSPLAADGNLVWPVDCRIRQLMYAISKCREIKYSAYSANQLAEVTRRKCEGGGTGREEGLIEEAKLTDAVRRRSNPQSFSLGVGNDVPRSAWSPQSACWPCRRGRPQRAVHNGPGERQYIGRLSCISASAYRPHGDVRGKGEVARRLPNSAGC